MLYNETANYTHSDAKSLASQYQDNPFVQRFLKIVEGRLECLKYIATSSFIGSQTSRPELGTVQKDESDLQQYKSSDSYIEPVKDFKLLIPITSVQARIVGIESAKCENDLKQIASVLKVQKVLMTALKTSVVRARSQFESAVSGLSKPAMAAAAVATALAAVGGVNGGGEDKGGAKPSSAFALREAALTTFVEAREVVGSANARAETIEEYPDGTQGKDFYIKATLCGCIVASPTEEMREIIESEGFCNARALFAKKLCESEAKKGRGQLAVEFSSSIAFANALLGCSPHLNAVWSHGLDGLDEVTAKVYAMLASNMKWYGRHVGNVYMGFETFSLASVRYQVQGTSKICFAFVHELAAKIASLSEVAISPEAVDNKMIEQFIMSPAGAMQNFDMFSMMEVNRPSLGDYYHMAQMSLSVYACLHPYKSM
jgi:hypothetical protein